jgi:hypothetical protein
MPAKSRRISGPYVFVLAHNPKVVSSNLTPATKEAPALSLGLFDFWTPFVGKARFSADRRA